jgi:hypothetical protein
MVIALCFNGSMNATLAICFRGTRATFCVIDPTTNLQAGHADKCLTIRANAASTGGCRRDRVAPRPLGRHAASADPLFMSAANAHGSRVIRIVLSGGDGDGADGLRDQPAWRQGSRA